MITDKKILLGLEERVYYMVMRPAMHYGSVIWPIKETSLKAARMRMMKWTCGHRDWI